jgi:hypothetical protein
VAPTASNQVLNWNGSAFTWSAGTISGIALGSNLATLTFGTFLTGTSYNGSTAVTIATNATNANTASTIVARDASGNFTAGTITAALSGNATTSSSTSGNAATATALSSGQTNWSGTGVIGNVVGMLAWKNYGNSHVIFDASQGTSPSGGAVNNTNSAGAWTASYPTLMGWNGSATYGVRVDSARTSDNTTGSSASCTGNAATATTATTATYLSGSGQINTIVGKNGTTADINNANDTGSMSVRGDASFPASISFHRTGAFAINMGVSTGNNFVIGGWSASSNCFVMSSVGALTMLNNITAYSDERVKTNWRDLRPDFIERLAEVKHGIYDRTDQVSTQVGVSAQSLQNILEHAVMSDAEGQLSVAYGNAALVAAVKLAERVVALEARLAALEAKG